MKTRINSKTKGFGRKTRRRVGGGTPSSPDSLSSLISNSSLYSRGSHDSHSSLISYDSLSSRNSRNSRNSNNSPEPQKPYVLASTPHMIQYNGDCALHALARSLSRTFQVLTIIDGQHIIRFYTLIYLMMIKLFNLTCDVGVSVVDLHSYINAILKKFYEYSKDDPSSDLDNYRYSDIPCNFLENNVCLLHDDDDDDDIIIKDVSHTAITKFKERFRKIYESKAFQVKQYMYEIDPTYPNCPTSSIVKLLKKNYNHTLGPVV
jgi:hypothetical protein